MYFFYTFLTPLPIKLYHKIPYIFEVFCLFYGIRTAAYVGSCPETSPISTYRAMQLKRKISAYFDAC